MSDAQKPLTVFLVAGEESGDRLGSALIRALRARTGGRLVVTGVGGHGMEAEGVQSLFPLGDLAIMGFTTIPGRLRLILRRIRETANAAIAARPDVVVLIDSPEFTHRVGKHIRANAPGLPIVDYVSPTVWAWRPWRARSMRRYVDHVLALLPFEPKVHQDLGGPPCTYVGHPVTERVGELRPTSADRAARDGKPPLLLVMPGSRRRELALMLPVFEVALSRVVRATGPLEIVVPTVPHLAGLVREAVARWPMPARVISEPDEKNAAFRQARAAMVKSGTGTLELAVAGVPMVAAYRVPKFEAFLVRPLINAASFILANLVLGRKVVPELVQDDCTPERLAEALIPLLSDTPARQAQVTAFAELDTIMEIGGRAPSDRAADIVVNLTQFDSISHRNSGADAAAGVSLR